MSDITELAEDWANLSIEMESDMGKTAVKLARAYLEQQKELITKSMEVEALHEKLRQALSTEDNSQELLKEAYETEIKLELKLEEQQKQIALKDEAIENIKEYNSLIPLHKNCDQHIIGYAKRIEAWCEKALTQDTSDYVLVKKEPTEGMIEAIATDAWRVLNHDNEPTDNSDPCHAYNWNELKAVIRKGMIKENSGD